ncbi:hypothetical protein HMPREF9614_01388 [Cutibacterium acnes HL002PA2]|nr:hypothetical protein HMPREF9576_02405 [Cutibacterium acnes HL110PA2]EFT05004.1 hypothetical protein HMPREF9614_01388 [Cutibacterium acnes HL002PA2]EFT19531.1 hypothetical protein HMPREF9566_02668 [Cutibacterium acnes HL045PA1]
MLMVNQCTWPHRRHATDGSCRLDSDSQLGQTGGSVGKDGGTELSSDWVDSGTRRPCRWRKLA